MAGEHDQVEPPEPGVPGLAAALEEDPLAFVWAVPILHPAFCLRDNEHWIPPTLDFLRRATQLQRRPPLWKENGVIHFPTVRDVERVLAEARKVGVLDVDVENLQDHPLNAQIRIIGIGTEEHVAVVHFVRADGSPYYWPKDERRVRALIRAAMRDPKLAKRGHNFICHDFLVIEQNNLGPIKGKIEDTMVAHHVGDSEMPHGLAYVTARYTECRYYKSMVADPEAKGGVDWDTIPDNTLASYNARDVLSTARAAPHINKLLNWKRAPGLYREEVEINHILRKMCVRGLHVDPKRQQEVSLKLQHTAEEKIAAMRSILGLSEFNPGSVPQVRAAFWEHLGFPLLKGKAYWTKSGQPSTGKQTIFELSLRAHGEAADFLHALSSWKKATKLLGTYVGYWEDGSVRGGPEILADGKVHPTWRLLTKTGRYACTPAVNTLPKKIKQLYDAEDGCFGAMDLNQAELRTIAEFMGVPTLKEIYARGLDAHTINTVRIFKVRPPKDYKPTTQDYLRATMPEYNQLEVDPEFEDGPRWITKRGVYAASYQAGADAIYRALRADTDPETGELSFPSLRMSQVMDFREAWRREQPEIPKYARSIFAQIQETNFYESPLSGRRVFYRKGVTLQEAANISIQEAIGAYMNKKIIVLEQRLQKEYRGRVVIVAQVHDQFVIWSPKTLIEPAMKLLKEVVEEPLVYYRNGVKQLFSIPGDKPKIGTRLSDV